ncbi:MAG: DeoR/GlpR family DNA-binding transcription regulator [Victivallaceae bacterium]|nr:DeoR/GlpR family DNA-binding transcription regulator [Victivallaceae bacterium]
MHERREAIFKYIEQQGEVTLAGLCGEFSNWSSMTIRRDLAALAAERRIILTKGGARMLPQRYGLDEAVYTERELHNSDAKIRIARTAATLITRGKGIFLDAGSTVMELARRMPDCDLAVVTNALNIALELATSKTKPSVVMLGGTLSRKTIAVADPMVMSRLEQINIDTAFMCTSGYDEKVGFSVGTELDAMLKRAVISRARRVVMLVDSSKFGMVLPFSFASLEDVDVLVSDAALPGRGSSKCKFKLAV